MRLQFAGPYHRDNGDCPYLPDREWAADYLLSLGQITCLPENDLLLRQNTFEDTAATLPEATERHVPGMDGLELFNRLLSAGFRRAGRAFYRPSCEGCAECVSIRVPVHAFRPSGDQKRALRKNPDVSVEIGVPTFDDEKLEMYRRFLDSRYPDGEKATFAGYDNFFLQHLGNTREFRYRVGGRLIGVGFVDLVRDAASSVYFYFDPDESPRSLGTYSAMREIDFCRQTGRNYLYLGFRITGCKAMSYKSNYRPHELLDSSHGWQAEEFR